MPRRNEKGFEARRQQIIEGALRAFAAKGYEEATNRDIAEAAGIGSPGLIYHYFKDKGDLFRAVLEQRVPLLQLLAHPEELLALPLEEALTRAGRAYLSMMDDHETTTFLRLLFGEAVRSQQVADRFAEVGPQRGLEFLAVYLERQMDAGTLRRSDPRIAARCFLGPLILLLLTREIVRQPGLSDFDVEAYRAAALDIFLHGMKPLLSEL
ncbi:MAG TPA: TetR/AcrR family transcriptional regulator [Chthonomonadaceae bacterium]|nr:TetR/AcrR family transcriptional regulator [Chthonomonadaceae bacterium]